MSGATLTVMSDMTVEDFRLLVTGFRTEDEHREALERVGYLTDADVAWLYANGWEPESSVTNFLAMRALSRNGHQAAGDR